MPQLTQTREEVQQILRCLMVPRKDATTTGVSISSLEREYKDQEGTPIPFRELGYSCLVDLFRSMPTSFMVRQRNGYNFVQLIENEKWTHVSSLVAGQNNTHRRPRGGRRPALRRTPWYPQVTHPPRRLDSRILSEIASMAGNRSNGVSISEVLRFIQERLNTNFELTDLKLQLRGINHELVLERDVIYSLSNYCQPVNSPQNNAYVQNSHVMNNNVPETTGNETQNVDCRIVNAPATFDNDGLNTYEENDDNNNNTEQIKMGTQEPSEKGNTDKDEDVQEIEDNQEVYENNVSGDTDNIGMLISERTRFRLEKLIQNHPEGIWCADLPDLYQKEYKLSLNYEELGFGSVSDFAAYLPDIFHALQLQNKGDFKLFDAKAERPDLRARERPDRQSLAALHRIHETYNQPEAPALPSLLPKEACEKLVPDGVMTLGETIPQISVTELDAGPSEHIDVMVVELCTPSFFWIPLLDRTTQFDKFMNDLHSFYTIHAKKYIMPIIIMEKGLNCACRYNDLWHRGIIKSVRHDNTVTVLFYDYGTVKSYPPEEIRFLHRSFSALLAQAIPCGHYNLKPVNSDKWTKSAAAQFSMQVMGKALVAIIGSIDVDNNSMLVGLTNTEESEDFHIGDWMVQNVFAAYGRMGDTVDMNDKTYDPISVDTYAPLSEGIRKPPGLSLETIAEEKSFNIATEMRFQQMLQMQEQIKAQLDELLELKNFMLESQNLGKLIPRMLENSQPPPIPALPNQLTNASSSHSVTSVPLVNGVSNLTDKVTSADFDFVTTKPPLSSNGFTAMPKLRDTLQNNFAANTTASSVLDDSVSQTTTQPSYNFTNFDASRGSQIPSSFNFSGNSVNVPKTFQFESRKWEPTVRRQFGESLTNTVNDFFNRVEARTRPNVEVPLRSALPDSNPFKVDLDKKYYYANSQEAPVLPSLPPSRAEKPWDYLMKADGQNQINSPAPKMVYEAPPILYDVPNKAASNTSNLSSVSTERKESYNCPSTNSQTEIYDETPEQRNLRLFIESSSTITAQRSIRIETTITGDSTNSKTTMRDPPPLPQRPLPFDFNSISLNEEKHYNDNFVDDTTLANRSRQTRLENAKRAIARRKPVALALKRQKKPNDLINQNGNVEREITANCGLDTEDPCQFRACQLSDNRTIYIFYMDNEGWLATEEFAATFTNILAMSMVNVLKALGVIVPYRTLSRIDNVHFFEKLERTSLAVSRDANMRIHVLHLTPLKYVIKILRKLKFVTEGEMELFRGKLFPNKSQVLCHVVEVIQDYAKFQQVIHAPSEHSTSM